MKKDLQQRQYWLEHYQQWQVSGLTQEVYCRKVKICFDHFRRWRCALIKSGDIVKPSNDKQPKEFKPLIISSSPDFQPSALLQRLTLRDEPKLNWLYPVV